MFFLNLFFKASVNSLYLTLLHPRYDGCKVVIQQDHVSSLFGDVRSCYSHGNANVSPL